MTKWRWGCVFAVALAFGCGDDDMGSADGGTDAPSGTCTTDDVCSDGFFCTGVERCDPSNPGANALGCVPGPSPCSGDCDEAADMCEGGECPDVDGDGFTDAACGGDDCDDTDADRFPGNPEICDDSHDEDCDAGTIGDDADGDGFVSSACCNGSTCGDDCDDTNAAVNPDVMDLCGNGDEDCDGAVDENPDELVYRDADGDGFGDDLDTMMACAASDGFARVGGDCDDLEETVNPGESEICDPRDVDENCSGEANEGCACPLGESRSCGTTDVGPCQFGTQTCILDGEGGSVWGACLDAIEPEDETCNSIDDDCDGMVDNGPGFQCVRGTEEMGANMCGRTGTRSCVAMGRTCRWSPPDFSVTESAATCDYCDDSGDGIATEEGFATSTETMDEPALDSFVSMPTGGSTAVGFSDPLAIGFGTVTFRFDIRIDEPVSNTVHPTWGWAIAMVREGGAGSLIGNPGFELGVPRARDGFSVEWRFNEDEALTDPDDSLLLRHLVASGADPVVGRAADPSPDAFRSTLHEGGSNRRQEVRFTLTPDVPGDADDDTEVVVEYFDGIWRPGTACGGSAPACPFTIRTGERYHFGYSMSFGPETRNYSASRNGTITRTNLCPEG